MHLRLVAAVALCAAVLAAPARAQDAAPPPAKDSPAAPAKEAKAPAPADPLVPGGKTAQVPAPGESVDEVLRQKGKEEARPVVRVDEIVVSADRGVPLTYPGGRDVVDEDDLRRYPDATIANALRRTPGVYFLPETGNDGRASIGIRGSDPRRSGLVTLMVDGIPVCEAPYGNTDVDSLPISFERIWRMDVIRGGASIRYGPNSAGGIINFVTAPIPETPTARFAARYGSDNDFALASSTGGTWEGVGVLLDIVHKGGDGFRENGAYDVDDVSAKFRVQVAPKDTLQWSISRYLELDAEQPGGLSWKDYRADPWQSTRKGMDLRYDHNQYSVRFEHEEAPGRTFQLIGWYQSGFRGFFDFRPVVPPFTVHRVQESVFSSGALEGRYTWDTDILGLKNSFFHSARYLVERNDEFYWRSPVAGGPKNHPLDLYAVFQGRAFSLFNEDVIALTDTVDLAVGARIESIDMAGESRADGDTLGKTYNLLLPETSVTWTPRPRTALYGSLQENFYAPQYETGFDPRSVGYAATRPESSLTREVGTRVREVKGVEFSAAAFRTDYRDKIDFVNLPSGVKTAVNSGRALSQGWEAGLNGDLGAAAAALQGLSLYGTMTRIHATIKAGPNDGNDTPHSPHTMTSWGTQYDHRSGLWGRIGGSHSARSYKDPGEFHTGSPNGVTGNEPATTIWDAAVGYRFRPDGKGLTLSVGMTNIFENEYYRRFSTGIFPGAPRQFFVAASYALDF